MPPGEGGRRDFERARVRVPDGADERRGDTQCSGPRWEEPEGRAPSDEFRGVEARLQDLARADQDQDQEGHKKTGPGSFSGR